MGTYWKLIEDDYIVAIGEGYTDTPITAEEYALILDAIRAKPTPSVDHEYRLREDLTWELVELPPEEIDPDPELTDTEAMALIIGGDTDA